MAGTNLITPSRENDGRDNGHELRTWTNVNSLTEAMGKDYFRSEGLMEPIAPSGIRPSLSSPAQSSSVS